MNIKGHFSDRSVYVNSRELFPDYSLHILAHSPDGFAWGYGGSGPAQLALAILLLATDTQTAIKLHQRFKNEFIATQPQIDLNLNVDVEKWLTEQNEKVDTSNAERSFKERAECSKGWDKRCAHAKSKKCTCACHGENHGTADQSNKLKV